MSGKTLGTMVAVMVIAWPAAADFVVDGRLDPSEGYATSVTFDLAVENYGTLTSGGTLSVHQDAATRDVYVFLGLSTSFVDNSYGENSIGWWRDAPSGKHHNFEDIIESDKARFQFFDGSGNVVLDFDLDYFSDLGGGLYGSEGASGEDGAIYVGAEADLLEYGTSLDHNFNALGYVLTEDSPATDGDYTENPAYPGWEFDVAYEARIDGALFAGRGFGGVLVPIVHASPNKLGRKGYPDIPEPVTPPPAQVVPEPTAAALFGIGSVLLLAVRRRRKRTDA